MKTRVNTLIIGAAKAGTTSLAAWLNEHTECCVSEPKETMFFASPKLFGRGVDWYHDRYFGHLGDQRRVCDATPAYSNRDRHPGTPARAASYNPDMKLIYLVRHPLRRVESAWRMFASIEPFEDDPILVRDIEMAKQGFAAYAGDDAISKDLISTSRYQYQLDAWLEHFPAANTKVLFLEDIKSNPDATIQEVCEFLELDPSQYQGFSGAVENASSQRRIVSPLRHWAAKTGLSGVAKRVAPRRLLDSLANSRLGSHTAQMASADWTDALRNHYHDQLSTETAAFLRSHGKPEDFYSLGPHPLTSGA